MEIQSRLHTLANNKRIIERGKRLECISKNLLFGLFCAGFDKAYLTNNLMELLSDSTLQIKDKITSFEYHSVFVISIKLGVR